MTTLAQIVQANKHFVEKIPGQHLYEKGHTISKFPNRQVAIFTCMDTRLVDFLEPAMGIKRGEVKIIKNAGNTITGPFASTIRSLLVAVFELGVKEIMVIGHLDCGMSHSNAEELTKKMLARGISPDAIKMVEGELKVWLDHFYDPVENVKTTVYKIRSNPLIPKDVPVHGLIFNPDNGVIEIIEDGYQATDE